MVATVVGGVALAGLGWLWPELVDDAALKDGVRTEIRGDDDLDYHVETIYGEDEGRSMAFADVVLPDASLLKIMNRQNGAVSSELNDRLRAMGGVNLGKLTLRINFEGRRKREIRIVDIRPVILKRSAGLGGTLFSVPSQGGTPIARMVINLHEPVPVAREVVAGNPFGDGTEGEPYFEKEVISLPDGKQKTLIVRLNEKRHHSTFYLQVDYLIANEKKRILIKDRGRPFQLTGLHCGPTPGMSSYKSAFGLDMGYKLEPLARPDRLEDSACS
ncbi:hypothetical protein ABZU75_05235 [Streptosporangium sp. NPDC005286]|uniref:hypothetical protein n=1 Tax=Streptosporangium sp. NPDC005286 TaxID=3154463 RepID=UPI0033ACAFE7